MAPPPGRKPHRGQLTQTAPWAANANRTVGS